MRILIVEDDPDLNRQLSSAMADAGYVTDSAHDGEEGHFLGDSKPYDAVILDHGTCFVAMRKDGTVLLERRPDKGLLGGMLGWPGDVWTTGKVDAVLPFVAEWHEVTEEARHTFTHFHLKLKVQYAVIPDDFEYALGQFIMLDINDLPTVMRKVWKLVPAVA